MNPPAVRKRFLSGVQPSGKLHLGNYFGAVKQHIALQDEGDCFYFIADYHSLTTIRDTAERLNEHAPKKQSAAQYQAEFSRDVALDYLALGLDPGKAAFYRQSDVPEVGELTWILSTVTSMGLLERAVSYKDKVEKGIESSAGLFVYPVLMAADILIVRSNVVPVGRDQVQHIEMTRDMAERFNRAYGEVFPIPNYRLDVGAKVPGIDGQKMSKSVGNTIDIFAEGNPLKKRVMSIVTDSKSLEDKKDPDTCNVFTLYSLFASAEEKAALAERYRAGGMGYGEAKKALLDKINEYFAAAREKRKDLAKHLDYVEEVLVKGSSKARAEARKTMELVRSAVGLKACPVEEIAPEGRNSHNKPRVRQNRETSGRIHNPTLVANMSEPEFRPGLADVPAAESAISFIDGQRARLEYRGIPAETLARESTFEETAWLLLKGDLPSQRELIDFKNQLTNHRRIKYRLIDLMKCLPESGHPMDALQTAVAAMGMFYPARDVSDPQINWEAVVRLIAKMPTVVAAFHRMRRGDEAIPPRDDLDHAANFYWMLFERVPSPAAARVLDACLILHAEHTMNASTFSARVTGSTLADPFSVIAAAIGTLTGPLHGGANEEVLDMLDEIASSENARPWLENAVAKKKKIMGFGHRVYKVKDPRATVLQDLAEEVFSETSRPKRYDIATEVERAAAVLLGPKGIYPNVDFYSGIVYDSLGIARDLFTPIFAIARVSGWLAHWLEQLKNNRIYRPEQVFVGKRDVPYVPLAKRP